MEALTKKIAKLQQQKEVIEREIEKVLQERNAALAHFIQTLPLTTLEPEILIGALCEVIEQAHMNPTKAEVWRQAGLKFLKRKTRPNTAAHNSAKTQSDETKV